MSRHIRAIHQAAVVLAALALCVGAAGAARADPTSTGLPSRLTKSGRTLWQFEALLHDTFAGRVVCATGRWHQIFTSGSCSPLAVYSPYTYVFAGARASAFHISSKKKVGGFGNYPVAVLIRGHPIACNARETQFLIKYRGSSASLTLACSRPGYVIA